jgi:oligopeptide/dipeptide ABC transporter ATP-binding protein
MYLGKVMEVGTRDRLYGDPKHPYTQALLRAVPVPDPDAERARRREALGGDPPSPIRPPAGCRFATRCPKVFDRCRSEAPRLRPLASGDRHVACHLFDLN